MVLSECGPVDYPPEVGMVDTQGDREDEAELV